MLWSVALAVLSAFVLLHSAPTAGAAARESTTSTSGSASAGGEEAAEEQAAELEHQRKQIRKLSDEVAETHTISTVILGPIAVLVGILALGGTLGIVFSVRDQRRVSQLHELTVGGEVLSQRRAEQSYASFFEQSQTTLSLVNDTLELAKEANETATQSMKRRAEEQAEAIEERAENLLPKIFREGDFEKLVYDAENRSKLHSIGDELKAVEGFLRLQNIDFPRHVRFVKAFDQFLLDDTEAALQGFRQLSQSNITGELRRFTLFWHAYICTTVGEYSTAVQIFQDDEVGLEKDNTERFQLECIIAETRFFERAKLLRETDPEEFEDTPLGRFQKVAELLDKLSLLALEVASSKDEHELGHVSLEIARTRADMYLWIAYDHERLDLPLPETPREAALNLSLLSDPAAEFARGELTLPETDLSNTEPGGDAESTQRDGEAVLHAKSDEARGLGADVFRGWALRHALEICKNQKNPNFDIRFTLAEALFMLGADSAEKAFIKAERALGGEFGDYLEKRRKVSLRQSELICHSRLLYLRKADKQEKESETRHVQQSERLARVAVSEMRQDRVTVFSQIQKRNVTRAEMLEEIADIVEQDHLDD
ncbi:MAG TPA: hypothetical protein VFJ64_12375 [Solirubrobacterales bacterium]|nr:hypothetical protein [Solirubrobacterales bacterium]